MNALYGYGAPMVFRTETKAIVSGPYWMVDLMNTGNWPLIVSQDKGHIRFIA